MAVPSQAVATAANGNFVVVWSNNGPGTNGWDIYARMFSAAGVPLGPPFLVNTTTTDDQINPAVAMNAAGNFVITWQIHNQDGSGWGVYAQSYNAAGQAQGGELLVNTTTQNDQVVPAVAMDAAGNFVITWSTNTGNGWGVHAQLFNAAGVAQGGEFPVNTYTQGDQELSEVAMDPAGDFVITWQSSNQDGSGWGIYAQRYNAAGVPQGTEFQVNTYAQNDQVRPTLAMDQAGNFIITWSSTNEDGSGWGIYAQGYNAAGVPQGGEFQVNTFTQNDQYYSTVAVDQSGNFVIDWSSHGQAGGNWGVYGQDYSAAGVPLGSETLFAYTSGTDSQYPSIAYDGGGTYVVVWDGSGGQPQNQGVFAQLVDTTQAGVSVNPRSGLTTSTAGGAGSFNVVLTSAPMADVTIPISNSDPQAGTISTSNLTFTPADWNIPQTVTVTGVINPQVTGDTAYSISVGPTLSTDPNYQNLSAPQVMVTNLETFSPGFSVTPKTGLVTTTAGAAASFSVGLTSQPTANVTIPVNSSNPELGNPSVTALTFTPANWNSPQTVTVTGVVTAVAGGNAGYQIQFGSAVSADPNYDGLVPSPVSITNLNQNTAGIKAVAGAGKPSSGGGGSADFSLVLTSPPTANVIVALGTAKSGTATLSESVLTFSPANWNVPQSVTVTSDAAGSQVTVKAATISADSKYSGLQAALSVAIPAATVSNPILNAPGGITIPVALTNTQPGASQPSGISARNSAEASNATTAVTVAGTTAVGGGAENAASATHAASTVLGDPGGSRSFALAEAAEADSAAALNLSSARQWILAATASTRNEVGPDPALSTSGSLPTTERPESENALGDTTFLAAVNRDGRRFDNAPSAAPMWQEFDGDAERDMELEIPHQVGVIAVTGLLASAGYVLLNTRAGVWALSLLTSRPLWNELDPLEIVCAWDKASEQHSATGAAQDETLLSLVEGGARGG